MSEQEIRALVRLLSDPNVAIAEQAGDALVEYGQEALPALQEFADDNPDLAAHLSRLIEARRLEESWAALAKAPDAERAAILLAQWLDPLADTEAMSAQLDCLAEPLHGILPSGTGRDAYRSDANALRAWLSEAQGFRGNVENYYAPENCLLPAVLKSRRGIPLSLSLVYLLVARRLGLPLYPIGMPYHFIVRYGDQEEGIYLDPFHQGALMSRRDCRRFLMQHNVVWRPEHLHPISDHALISRMLRNLVNAYAMRGDDRAVAQAVRYLDIWTDHHAGDTRSVDP